MNRRKSRFSALFRFRFAPTKDTLTAAASGCLVILLSVAMYLFKGDTVWDKIGIFVLRDVLMITVAGFAFPLYYTLVYKKGSLRDLGVTKHRLLTSLLLNAVFAAGLLMMFLSESAGQDVRFGTDSIIPVLYIITAGIFEIVFFYGFLRSQFEKAFGIIPGILLAAVFYSLHHAGFQPEFFKLLFVGILYAGVFRLTGSAFAVFPLFWGVGAVWDVLVNFGAQEQLSGMWTLAKAAAVLLMMLIIALALRRKLYTDADQR